MLLIYILSKCTKLHTYEAVQNKQLKKKEKRIMIYDRAVLSSFERHEHCRQYRSGTPHWDGSVPAGFVPALGIRHDPSIVSFQVLYLLCWFWLLFLDNNGITFVFVWLQSGVLLITAIRWLKLNWTRLFFVQMQQIFNQNVIRSP